MPTEDRLGPGKILALDPDLSRHARNVADTGVQVIAEHLTANALLLERLLPDVGLKRVRGRGKANNVVMILRMHDIPPSRRQVLLRLDRTAGRLPGIKPARQCMSVLKALFAKLQRHTGAGLFLGSGSVND
jgi:hypothetical protein